ncbi:hypothetical protein U7230_03415 [Carboxydochorda subterranea]|uniref:Outer membrane protein beta-barrel domain-containing protein n=1 Tax=Carboxydichorda subterranea TaxID=3109565 RepID=A0ABZ1BZ21_9FIRM|nr:hypothetical protein [Limnochorda sp. L945t]WRP18069.1 hypothetical protein U7230_03415 [Limnochorda sp. L945t]
MRHVVALAAGLSLVAGAALVARAQSDETWETPPGEEMPSGMSDVLPAEGGVAGVYGEAGYQRFNLDEINSALAGKGLPQFQQDGLTLAWGFVAGADSLQIRGGGAHSRFESREEGKGFSRLTIDDGYLGVHWTLAGNQTVRLTGGGNVGLAQVALETYAASAPVQLGSTGGSRYTRFMLTLEPQAAVQVYFTPRVGLELRAGYRLATDFWNAKWARADGQTVDQTPAVLNGPTLRLGLLLGSF